MLSDTHSPNHLPPIDFVAELNEEQYAAVSAPDGPALVLAGAGSGKTRTLTYRVAWLLHKGVAPWNILLLTFTNKAAKEMLERVEDLTGVPRHQFWGGTFHSVGQRILRAHGEKVGLSKQYTIMDQGDAESLLGEVMREVDKDFVKNKENPKPRALADLISYARNTGLALDDLTQDRYPFSEEYTDKFAAFAKAYRERKYAAQVADYDDLLELLRDVLRDPDIAAHYQNKFRYVLVDEYQDTNTLQSEIVDRLAAHHHIMAVGDDAQCIYTWRGANFDNIMTFPERHPHTHIYKIETNYRSSPEILNFANRALDAQPSGQGYHKELRAVRPKNQKPYFVPVMDGVHQAHFVLNRMRGLLDEGHAPQDIAVLYRAHYQSMDLQMELSRQGIPYTITSGVRFFEQAHIRDLVAQLRFAHNPGDTVAFARVLCLLPRVGPRSAESILKLARELAQKQNKPVVQMLTDEKVLKKVPADAREDFTDLAYTMQDIASGMPETVKPPSGEAQGDLFSFAEEQVMQGSEQSERRGEAPQESHRSVLSPSEIVQIAIDGWYGDFLPNVYPQNWQTRRDDLDSLVAFASRYEDMTQLLSELVLLNAEASNKSTEVAEDSVRLMTIHQAKGLEFPAVFVLGAAQGLFPLRRAIDRGDVEEERRLFYVAVTRAMDELYITCPRVAQQGGGVQMLEPTAFIQEIPENCYEILKVRRSY